MSERKMKTSVILKTLEKMQNDYDEDSQEYLALKKAMLIIDTLTNIRRRLAEKADDYKTVQ